MWDPRQRNSDPHQLISYLVWMECKYWADNSFSWLVEMKQQENCEAFFCVCLMYSEYDGDGGVLVHCSSLAYCNCAYQNNYFTWSMFAVLFAISIYEWNWNLYQRFDMGLMWVFSPMGPKLAEIYMSHMESTFIAKRSILKSDII